MKILLAFSFFALSACTHTPQAAYSPTHFAPGNFSKSLEADIADIEYNNPDGWTNLSRLVGHVDAEKSETLSVACAYLARRDPTIFLRRYLAGDAAALDCGQRAYAWSSRFYRRLLDSIYLYRLIEAKSPAEKQKIEFFIAQTTKTT